MKHPITRQMFAYWNSLRGARPAPRRQDVEPAELSHLLTDAFMLDVPGFSFRLAGTTMRNRMGCELRGKSLFDLVRAEDHSDLGETFADVTGHGAAAVFGLTLKTDRRRCDVEMIVLPLMNARGEVDRVIGCTAWFDPPVDTMVSPPRFSSLSVNVMRRIWPSGRRVVNVLPGGPLGAATAGTAGTLAALRASLGRQAPGVPARRVGHLMVYEGGRTPSLVPA